jgi:hypothetical protein
VVAGQPAGQFREVKRIQNAYGIVRSDQPTGTGSDRLTTRRASTRLEPCAVVAGQSFINQPVAQRPSVEPRWGMRAANVGLSVAEWATAPHAKTAGTCVEIIFVGILLCDRLKHAGCAAPL